MAMIPTPGGARAGREALKRNQALAVQRIRNATEPPIPPEAEAEGFTMPAWVGTVADASMDEVAGWGASVIDRNVKAGVAGGNMSLAVANARYRYVQDRYGQDFGAYRTSGRKELPEHLLGRQRYITQAELDVMWAGVEDRPAWRHDMTLEEAQATKYAATMQEVYTQLQENFGLDEEISGFIGSVIGALPDPISLVGMMMGGLLSPVISGVMGAAGTKLFSTLNMPRLLNASVKIGKEAGQSSLAIRGTRSAVEGAIGGVAAVPLEVSAMETIQGQDMTREQAAVTILASTALSTIFGLTGAGVAKSRINRSTKRLTKEGSAGQSVLERYGKDDGFARELAIRVIDEGGNMKDVEKALIGWEALEKRLQELGMTMDAQGEIYKIEGTETNRRYRKTEQEVDQALEEHRKALEETREGPEEPMELESEEILDLESEDILDPEMGEFDAVIEEYAGDIDFADPLDRELYGRWKDAEAEGLTDELIDDVAESFGVERTAEFDEAVGKVLEGIGKAGDNAKASGEAIPESLARHRLQKAVQDLGEPKRSVKVDVDADDAAPDPSVPEHVKASAAEVKGEEYVPVAQPDAPVKKVSRAQARKAEAEAQQQLLDLPETVQKEIKRTEAARHTAETVLDAYDRSLEARGATPEEIEAARGATKKMDETLQMAFDCFTGGE